MAPELSEDHDDIITRAPTSRQRGSRVLSLWNPSGGIHSRLTKSQDHPQMPPESRKFSTSPGFPPGIFRGPIFWHVCESLLSLDGRLIPAFYVLRENSMPVLSSHSILLPR